jgi:hypothetical protein
MDLWLKLNLIFSIIVVIAFGFDFRDLERLVEWFFPPRVYLLMAVVLAWLVFILVTVW